MFYHFKSNGKKNMSLTALPPSKGAKIMYRTEIPIYSKEDLLRTLDEGNYTDEVWDFVSNLTGLSVDRLNELLDELKSAEKHFTMSAKQKTAE